MTAPGFATVSRAVLRARGLSGQAKLCYALLQSHADEHGRCYPSLVLLAEQSGWSRPTVIKAIDELVRAGLVVRERHRFTNHYQLTESTSFTPSLENGVNHVDSVEHTESTTFTPSSTRSKAGLRTESTSFTPVNENHLTRSTGYSGTSGIASKPPDLEASAAASPVVQVPAELASFDAALRGQPGYEPTEAFFAKVGKYRGLDLEEEAIKMASWLRQTRQRQGKRQCSVAFVLNWLKRASMPSPPPNGYHKPGRGPGSRQEHGVVEYGIQAVLAGEPLTAADFEHPEDWAAVQAGVEQRRCRR